VIPDERKRPNWLLRGFVFVSLGIHAVALIHISGLYNSQAVTYIELTLQGKERPAARSIPRPPQRRKTVPPLDAQKAAPVLSVPVKPPPVPPAARITPVENQTLVESLAAPDLSEVPKPEAVAWSPPSIGPSGPGSYSSSMDYFSMVRMRIESRKKYPHSARERQNEGRVVVRFVIGTDGMLNEAAIAERSHYQVLNQAALEAVRNASPFPRPPERLFSGPVSLEVSIVFELM